MFATDTETETHTETDVFSRHLSVYLSYVSIPIDSFQVNILN